MIFTTQIYMRSRPTVARPVVVSFKRLLAMGMPVTRFDFEVEVMTDEDGDGVGDAGVSVGNVDFVKKFSALPSQLDVVSNRLRGGGNLMAGVRAFCKARVNEHNAEVNPSGAAAVHVDIDTDDPV